MHESSNVNSIIQYFDMNRFVPWRALKYLPKYGQLSDPGILARNYDAKWIFDSEDISQKLIYNTFITHLWKAITFKRQCHQKHPENSEKNVQMCQKFLTHTTRNWSTIWTTISAENVSWVRECRGRSALTMNEKMLIVNCDERENSTSTHTETHTLLVAYDIYLLYLHIL